VIGREASLGYSAMAGRAHLVAGVLDLVGDDRIHRGSAVWTLITKGLGNEQDSSSHKRDHDQREYHSKADSLLWHGSSLLWNRYLRLTQANDLPTFVLSEKCRTRV
jgi:hypothetical protein